MNSRSPCREGDVGTIVDKDARPRSAGEFDGLGRDAEKRAIVQSPFTNLDQIDPAVHGCCNQVE